MKWSETQCIFLGWLKTVVCWVVACSNLRFTFYLGWEACFSFCISKAQWLMFRIWWNIYLWCLEDSTSWFSYFLSTALSISVLMSHSLSLSEYPHLFFLLKRIFDQLCHHVHYLTPPNPPLLCTICSPVKILIIRSEIGIGWMFVVVQKK